MTRQPSKLIRKRQPVDTHIVRGVYEELQAWFPVADVPLRSEDQLVKDLHLDDERDEIAENIAFRAGRSLENVDLSPLYGTIETVADLISFMSAQPRSGS